MKHSNLDDLVSELTLEEKASLLSGANFWNTKEVERLDVPSMMLTDGPHGLFIVQEDHPSPILSARSQVLRDFESQKE